MDAKAQATSVSNPHISESFSPLETLIMSALRRYGTVSAATISADVALMMLEFANNVVEDIRSHPYWDGTPIEYYISLTDRRNIPDEIVVAGMLSYFCLQQQSSKAQIFGPTYYRRTNQILYNRLYGNKRLEINVKDRSPNSDASLSDLLASGLQVGGPFVSGTPSDGGSE
jgi:hypothetical protein